MIFINEIRIDPPGSDTENEYFELTGTPGASLNTLTYIVIGDDDLHSIYQGIVEGRTVHKNLKSSIHYLLSTNLSEILLMLGGIGSGLGVPLNPMQLLWINLLTDVFPSIALSLEPPNASVMIESPKRPDQPMFNRSDKSLMIVEGIIISGLAFLNYAWALKKSPANAGTQAFLTLTLAQLVQAYNMNDDSSKNESDPKGNRLLTWTVVVGIALVFLALASPTLRTFLGNRKVGLTAVLRSTAFAGISVLCNRWLRRQFQKRRRKEKKMSSMIDVHEESAN